MKQAKAEYLATRPELRHRVSEEFFGPGPLSGDIDIFIDGGVCSARLANEIESMRFLLITEESIEAPHSHMQREKLRQRAASRAWQSCTSRLQNNFEHYDALGDLVPMMHREWRMAKRVLQVHPDRQHRPMAVSFKKLKAMVYRCSLEVPTFGELRAKTAATIDEVAGPTDMQYLGTEYLRAVFRQQVHYTLGKLDLQDGDVPGLQVFQVIWVVSPNLKLLSAPGEVVARSLDLGIQRFEVQRFADDLSSFEAYAVGDVVHVDGLKLASWKDLRTELRSWSVVNGERAACLRFLEPKVAEPTLSALGLADPSVPLFLIILRLKQVGWRKSSDERPAVP